MPLTIPPPIQYHQGPPPSPPNRWWKVLLRILAGMAAGAASCVLGAVLYGMTSSWIIGVLPLTALLVTAIVIAATFRRFGYVTGVLLAPILIGVGLYVLIVMICGPMLSPH